MAGSHSDADIAFPNPRQSERVGEDMEGHGESPPVPEALKLCYSVLVMRSCLVRETRELKGGRNMKVE